MWGSARTLRRLIGGGLLAGLVAVTAAAMAQVPESSTPAEAPLETLPGVSATPVEGAAAAPVATPEAPLSGTELPATPTPADGGTAEADPPLRPGVEPTPVPANAAADELRRLEEIESSLTLSNDRVEQLKQEIEDMKGDQAQQSAALIAAAQRVRTAETDVAAIEDRLGELIVQELQVRGRLEGSNATISTVLAALERISRNPPPALIVDPSDALGSARSAILMSAILPDLRAKADALLADLGRLAEIKGQAQEEELNLRANLSILEEEQLRVGTLMAARRQGEQLASTELAAEQQAAQQLAADAAALRARIADLTRQAGAVAEAAQATAAADAGQSAPRLDRETIRLALANPDRRQPAVPFDQAKGWLTLPSSGVRVVDYGAGDGFGGISQGLSIVTRAEASVVAPADGWVLYTGNYLNYGQIVILNTGQDYTVLLAGLASVSVEAGQFVLMGQQVGSMGSRTIGRTVSTNAGAASPTLYIEMRKNNVPVDPTGWWVETETTTQSG